MLRTRLVLGGVFIVVAVVLISLDERLKPWYPGWLVLTLLTLLFSTRELMTLLRGRGLRANRILSYVGVAAIVLTQWLRYVAEYETRSSGELAGVTRSAGLPPGFSGVMWVIATTLMMSLLIEAWKYRHPGHTVLSVAATLLVLSYLGVLGTFAVQLRWLGKPGSHLGACAVASLIFTAKGSDIGGYFTGRVLGRHKLSPLLSPNKTIEGAVGGVVLAVLIALLVIVGGGRLLQEPTFSPALAVLFGLLIGLVAILGDLMESMIKRDCERKDTSQMVPGFGGVLDLLDSILFAAPVAYAIWAGWLILQA